MQISLVMLQIDISDEIQNFSNGNCAGESTEKTLDGSNKLPSDDERNRTGKGDFLRCGMVDGCAADKATTEGSEPAVSDKTGAASDVEQKQQDCDTAAVKGRRSASLPAGNARY